MSRFVGEVVAIGAIMDEQQIFRSAQDNEDACRNGMQRTYVMYNTRFRR